MATLDTSQIDQYRDQGFLVVESVLTDEELRILRERTRDIADGRVADFPDEYLELEPSAAGVRSLETVRKINVAEADPVFLAHAQNERILDIVEELLGPNIKLYGSQIFMKPPGGVEKPYHQDSPYFSIEPMALVTCWTALDDVTIENGCMRVIPGSHHSGAYEHSEPWVVGDRTDMRIPESSFDLSQETPITMPAGSCSLHHSLILHCSQPNRTTKSRRGVATHYMAADSRWTHPTEPQPEYLLMRGDEIPGCV